MAVWIRKDGGVTVRKGPGKIVELRDMQRVEVVGMHRKTGEATCRIVYRGKPCRIRIPFKHLQQDAIEGEA